MLLKVAAAVVITLVVLLATTYSYVAIATRAPKGSVGQIGIDASALKILTVGSPAYWIVVFVVLILLGLLFRRFLFAA